MKRYNMKTLARIASLLMMIVFWGACSGTDEVSDTIDVTEEAIGSDGATLDVREIECVPHCEGLECGYDGCGGSCGDCPAGTPLCSSDGLCEVPCEPQCEGKECGPNGCGGSCGQCGFNGDVCVEGVCRFGQGSPCEENGECASGYCVEFEQGKICTITCEDECPGDWACTQVQLAPDFLAVCLPTENEPD